MAPLSVTFANGWHSWHLCSSRASDVAPSAALYLSHAPCLSTSRNRNASHPCALCAPARFFLDLAWNVRPRIFKPGCQRPNTAEQKLPRLRLERPLVKPDHLPFFSPISLSKGRDNIRKATDTAGADDVLARRREQSPQMPGWRGEAGTPEDVIIWPIFSIKKTSSHRAGPFSFRQQSAQLFALRALSRERTTPVGKE